jgi:hypothetical protein
MEEELEKLDRWADDKRTTLRSVLDELDLEVKELKKTARNAPNLPEKLEKQKKLRQLEVKRDEAWHFFDIASREIDEKKESLLDDISRRMQQKITKENIFEIRWRLK